MISSTNFENERDAFLRGIVTQKWDDDSNRKQNSSGCCWMREPQVHGWNHCNPRALNREDRRKMKEVITSNAELGFSGTVAGPGNPKQQGSKARSSTMRHSFRRTSRSSSTSPQVCPLKASNWEQSSSVPARRHSCVFKMKTLSSWSGSRAEQKLQDVVN